MTSYSRLQTNIFGEICWHNMHIIPNALSLLVTVQYVTVMNTSYQRSKLEDRSRQSSAQLQ